MVSHFSATSLSKGDAGAVGKGRVVLWNLIKPLARPSATRCAFATAGTTAQILVRSADADRELSAVAKVEQRFVPFLMHIAFDNPYRLRRRVNYFEYKGIQFKLIQNDARRWSDVLLTITDSYRSPDVQRAYKTAGEFASAFAWRSRVGVSIGGWGGPGVPAGFTLKKARCVSFTFPRLPYHGKIGGYVLDSVAKIDSEEQRIALTLYREAKSSNKIFLSVLFFWQILEVAHKNPDGWVNKAVRTNRQLSARVADELSRLNLNGRSLGNYLANDCRHAIAHVKRHAGKKALQFDDEEENTRLGLSARILEELAAHYIAHELGVTNTLYLVRKGKRGFPVFLDTEAIKKGGYTGVKQPPLKLFRKS